VSNDCDPAEGPPCSDPEHSVPSGTIVATPEECCQTKLGWIGDLCVAKSKNIAYYTDKYHVDCKGFKCAKECDPKAGLPMGNPPALSGVPTERFDTAEACCVGNLGWFDVGQSVRC